MIGRMGEECGGSRLRNVSLESHKLVAARSSAGQSMACVGVP